MLMGVTKVYKPANITGFPHPVGMLKYTQLRYLHCPMIYHWKSHNFCQEAGSNFKGALDWLVRKTSLTQAAVPRHGLDPIVMNFMHEKRCRFVVFEDLDQIEIGDFFDVQ